MKVEAATGVYAQLEQETPEFLKRLDATLAKVTEQAQDLRHARMIFQDHMPELYASYSNAWGYHDPNMGERIFLARYHGPTMIVLKKA